MSSSHYLSRIKKKSNGDIACVNDEEFKFHEIAFHDWIAEHTGYQVGSDEYHRLYESNIQYLLSVCRQVSNNHMLANILLPTRGLPGEEPDYSTHYFNEVNRTRDALVQILEEMDWDCEELYYYVV